jgi:hypothetical protein
MQAAEFLAQIARNRANREIIARLPALGLPSVFLVAGCLFQTIWNIKAGRDPAAGIKDYDVFYFDAADLSWEAEDRHIRRCGDLLADLGIVVEIRNQARVHLWYEQHFGAPYPSLSSAREAIDRFLILCTCVGVHRRDDGTIALYAPNGLEDLQAGILRRNPINDQPQLFAAKATSYRSRWPWLTVATD